MSLRTLLPATAAALVAVLASDFAASQPVAPAPEAPAEPPPLEPQEARELEDPLPDAFRARPGGLTASELARRAVATSPDIVARRAELEAAAARVDAAMLGFLPRLTLSATYTRLSPVDSSLGGGALVGARNPGLLSVGACPTGGGTCVLDSAGLPVGAAAFEIETVLDNYSLRAALSVPISDYVLKLSHSMAAAESNEQAAALNVRAERAKIAADAKVTFYNWTRGIGQLAVAEKSLERTQARLKDTQTAFRLGTATQADVLRLEAQVASTEAAIEAARAFRDLAADQIRILLDQRSASLVIGENVLGKRAVGTTGSKPLASLVARAYTRRLELKALAATQRSLEKGATVARRSRLPRLDAFGDYTYANPNQRAFPQTGGWSGSWQAGLSLTWTVNEALSAGATAHELDANARQARARLRSLRNGVRLEVTQSYLDFRRAKAALSAAVRAAAASQAAYGVARALYRFGKATTTELIDAEGELVAAQLGRINAQIDLLVAEVRLQHAVGDDVV